MKTSIEYGPMLLKFIKEILDNKLNLLMNILFYLLQSIQIPRSYIYGMKEYNKWNVKEIELETE